MAAAAVAYGTPVNLDLGGAYADLGAEQRDGQPVVVLALDDGNGFTNLALTPELAGLLADCLRGLAAVRPSTSPQTTSDGRPLADPAAAQDPNPQQARKDL